MYVFYYILFYYIASDTTAQSKFFFVTFRVGIFFLLSFRFTLCDKIFISIAFCSF